MSLFKHILTFHECSFVCPTSRPALNHAAWATFCTWCNVVMRNFVTHKPSTRNFLSHANFPHTRTPSSHTTLSHIQMQLTGEYRIDPPPSPSFSLLSLYRFSRCFFGKGWFLGFSGPLIKKGVCCQLDQLQRGSLKGGVLTQKKIIFRCNVHSYNGSPQISNVVNSRTNPALKVKTGSISDLNIRCDRVCV